MLPRRPLHLDAHRVVSLTRSRTFRTWLRVAGSLLIFDKLREDGDALQNFISCMLKSGEATLPQQCFTNFWAPHSRRAFMARGRRWLREGRRETPWAVEGE